jgi:hypothetical protein
MLRKTKGPSVGEAAAAPEWGVSEGNYDGNPMFARFNAAFKDCPDRATYPIQIGVALPLHSPNEQGLPRKPEFVELDAAEETVIDEAGERAILVGVITTRGMREFVLYTATAEWIESFDLALQQRVESHTVQVMAKNDPKWTTYRQYVR